MLPFKARFPDGSTRRISLPASTTYADVVRSLASLPAGGDGSRFAVESLTYVDDEGDAVAIGSDLELAEAASWIAQRSPLNVRFVEKDSQPSTPSDGSAWTAWNGDISFALNGEQIVLPSGTIDPSITLNAFLREHSPRRFTGTKLNCAKGGCGACAVVASFPGAATTPNRQFSLNSCLRPLCLCDGLVITTTEGLGKVGAYHPVQTAIADGNGSQCGFCTPGMVMAMYSLLSEKEAQGEDVLAEDIERRFDGNICRCTGYRPILQSFRAAFATDAAAEGGEDAASRSASTGAGGGCCGARSRCAPPPLSAPSAGIIAALAARASEPARWGDGASGTTMWLRPTTIPELAAIIAKPPSAPGAIEIVGAHTGIGGVWQSLKHVDVSTVRVLTSGIAALHDIAQASTAGVVSLNVGSAVPLTLLAEALGKTSAALRPAALVDALSRIASWHVRNVGSWAGNIAMARNFGFPSDLATTLIALGATLTLLDASGATTANVAVQDYVAQPPPPHELTVILALCIPLLEPDETSAFFKLALRPQNAHSLINGAVRARLGGSANAPIFSAKPGDVRLCFGALDTLHAHRAPKTEAFLAGKALLDPATLSGALASLAVEIVPLCVTLDEFKSTNQPTGKVEFRKTLIASSFYRFYLALIAKYAPTHVPAALSSACVAMPESRPLSEARETMPIPDPGALPLTKPMTKLSARRQAAGEAVYTADLVPSSGNHIAAMGAPRAATPPPLGCWFAAFVTSSEPHAIVASIDSSAALAMDGVHSFVGANDVAGVNDVGTETASPLPDDGDAVLPTTEPLFVSEGEATMFAGQPIGVIVANSRALAEKAALAVVITYTAALTAAILTLPSAIAAKSFQSTDFGSQTIESGDVNAALASAPKKVTATLSTFGMRHFTMEAQTALAYSDEGRHVVFTSSQNPDGARRAVARVLGVSGAAVSVKMRRAGGAYGSKLTRSLPIAAAVAVASDSIGAPVKMQCDMSTQMRLFGGRHPIQAEYTVGFTASGQILAVDLATYFDGGAYLDTSIDSVQEFQRAVDGVTFWPTFRAVATLCRTNSAPRTSCRAPGHMTASYVSETIVERVAQECGLDVNAVRLKNMYTARNCITPFGEFVDGYPRMLQVWAQLHTSADWDARVAAAKAFNAANKWRKRGISQQAVKYGVCWFTAQALINVESDGSVTVAHGQTEVGQGIHTRIAAVAAQTLGCSMDDIHVVDTNTEAVPNAQMTGGSVSTGSAAEAVRVACLKLKLRLAPFKDALWKAAVMTEEPGWKAIVAAASSSGMSFAAEHCFAGGPGESALMPGWGDGVDGAYAGATSTEFFSYYNFGSAVTEVELDVLTGEHEIIRTDVLYDCGRSLNPELDIGQVEGAFTMGLGWYTREEEIWGDDGSLKSDGTWQYKPPCSIDVPLALNVELLQDSPEPKGILRSKAVGEPPAILSFTVLSALKQAIYATRRERGHMDLFELTVPATVDRIGAACAVEPQELVL